MNCYELKEHLLDHGFTQIGIPETSGADVFAYLSEKTQMEIMRVKIKEDQNSVEIENNKSHQIHPIGERVAKVLHDLLLQAHAIEDEKIGEDDKKVARLIHEIKTIRLKPEDRLAVIINEDVNHLMLDRLRQTLLGWLGERNSNRIVVLKGNIEFLKIKNIELIRKEDE